MKPFFIALITLTGFALMAPRAASGEDFFKPDMTALPTTYLFDPLRADPKEPRFFVSTIKIDSSLLNTTLGAVGFGENFGIVRRQTRKGVDWQIGISGAVFAQFDLKAPSSDLVNADYVFSIPLTWRHEKWSGRVRLYHQSSHLGDEFLLRTQPERVNLSFEAIELIASYDFYSIRLYGGGEYLLRHEPDDLDESLLHAGVDWHGREVVMDMAGLGGAHWVAGVDVKRWQQSDWQMQMSVKAGLEFAPLNDNRQNARRWSVLAEVYDGPSPYGQFYPMDIRYWGVALQLGM